MGYITREPDRIQVVAGVKGAEGRDLLVSETQPTEPFAKLFWSVGYRKLSLERQKLPVRCQNRPFLGIKICNYSVLLVSETQPKLLFAEGGPFRYLTIQPGTLREDMERIRRETGMEVYDLGAELESNKVISKNKDTLCSPLPPGEGWGEGAISGYIFPRNRLTWTTAQPSWHPAMWSFPGPGSTWPWPRPWAPGLGRPGPRAGATAK